MSSDVGSYDEFMTIVYFIDNKPENFIELVNNGLDLFKKYYNWNCNMQNNLLERSINACSEDRSRVDMVMLIASYYLNDDFSSKYTDDVIIKFLSDAAVNHRNRFKQDFFTLLVQFVDFFVRHNLFINTNDMIKRQVDNISGYITLKKFWDGQHDNIDANIRMSSDIIIIIQNYSRKRKTLFELMLPILQ